jgi:hypothetical protein
MPSNRRKLRRPFVERRYRKLFIISVEGVKTEPQYFSILNGQNSVVKVNCLKDEHETSPPKVLKRMKDYLKKEALRTTDEAWLVVDKDRWNEEQLAQLYAWSQDHDNYGFALSNPKFEYWLLLHFEDGNDIGSSRECSDRLKRYLPDYEKGIDARKFTLDRITEAVRRGKVRDIPPSTDWPRALGKTTVYKLVENIINS